MCTATDTLAMRIEQDHLNAGNTMRGQRLADLQAQPFDQVACCELSDIAAGIRIAELQRKTPSLLEVCAIVRAAQRLLQYSCAMFKSACSLEQWADLDMTLDVEQPRQP